MTARLSALSRSTQLALVCAVSLLVLVGGWLAFVAPKRSTASDLKQQTASVQAQIDRNRSSAFARALPAVRSASFDEIAPQTPATDTAFDVEPITVQFTGNFYNLSDFLLRLRNLVRVEHGRLLARGRIFAVSDLAFAEAQKKFPIVTATMTVNAFVPAPQQSPASTASSTPATQTSTSTTGTSTTPQPAGSSAAPQGGHT